jgi:activating signal cointegrator 1
MKALSVIQPWASLIILGAKRFETRSWKTGYRGPLLIHSSKKLPPAAEALCGVAPFNYHISTPARLPLGCLLGVVEVIECKTTTEIADKLNFHPGIPEACFGDYRPGRWAWELRVLQRFEEPIRANGHLGLWDYIAYNPIYNAEVERSIQRIKESSCVQTTETTAKTAADSTGKP